MIQFTQGCTEPAAIALNASFAGHYLKDAKQIVVDIDKMTFKNAFNAGIPNSNNNVGCEFASLFGYLIADYSKELQIFQDLNDKIIKKAKNMLSNIKINIIDRSELYIKTTASNNKDSVYAVTKGNHTNITEVSLNGEKVIEKDSFKDYKPIEFEKELYNTEHWETIINTLYDNEKFLKKIKDAILTNRQAAYFSRKYDFSDKSRVLSAVYSRMKGDAINVASCAGSGNKGLSIFITIDEYAKKISAKDEKTYKAAILACFVTSIITAKFGFVSSVCGVVHAASVGVIAGILYLDNKLNLFLSAYENYISAVAGTFCDGAKKSCSMKAFSSTELAKQSVELSKSGLNMDYKDGFLGVNFYKTVDNLKSYDKFFKMFDEQTINIMKNK